MANKILNFLFSHLQIQLQMFHAWLDHREFNADTCYLASQAFLWNLSRNSVTLLCPNFLCLKIYIPMTNYLPKATEKRKDLFWFNLSEFSAYDCMIFFSFWTYDDVEDHDKESIVK